MVTLKGEVLPRDIYDEVKSSYLDYAMSVIVGRALPDVRDGLKPVHRRILYTMYETAMWPDKPYRKSARLVGDVLGRYHPHGDSAVYDAVVRLAQNFATRYLLVDGHGNFGSIDGDSAAAMRYTEVKMTRLTQEMLSDIDQDTVDYIPNYDDSLKEPVVLPSRYPNLLVNGSTGIAVGMATNIPPHNLGEVIDSLIYLIEHPESSIDELRELLPGPDFPTGGLIIGYNGLKNAYEHGRGSIIMRGRTTIEKEKNGKSQLIITELPYQVNKARLVEKIAELIKEKRLEGISDLRDESDRSGMRIVLDLKKEANSQLILKRLYKHTQLQDTFGVIMLALVEGRPQLLNLRQVLQYYLDHQVVVIKRRTSYQLRKAEERLHIVEGLVTALDYIDEVVALIRGSKDVAEARKGLQDKFGLSEKQAQAILDMRLQRLTALERNKLLSEKEELEQKILYLKELLGNEDLIKSTIKKELLEIKKKYKDDRRTQILPSEEETEELDMIPEEVVAVTLTNKGYIKRIPADVYHSQHRGGKGVIGLTTREEDYVEDLFVTTTHNYLLFFTNRGRLYKLLVHNLPEGTRQAKGSALVNLLPLRSEERVTAVIPLKEYLDGYYLFFATKKGVVKKGVLKDYSSARRDGIIATLLNEGDEVIGVKLTNGKSEILLATRKGIVMHFQEDDVRTMGRVSAGVRGIKLRANDEVVAMEEIRQDADLLVVTEKGYGKRTPLSDFRLQRRGGMGIAALKVSERNGTLVGIKIVDQNDEILLVSAEGNVIRMEVQEISAQGRYTQGVRLMRLDEGERLVALAKVDPATSEEDNDIENDK